MRLDALKPGDIVDIIAPASRCKNDELASGVKAVRELGLVPRVPRNLFGDTELFSNRDDIRLKHLRDALFAPDSKMIWCVRGGYGALRLMPEVSKWSRPKRAKIFLGYSDITTLHAHLNQKWKWPTIHGPLLDRLGRGAMSPKEKRELFGMIFGRQLQTVFENLKPLNAAARGAGEIRGRVTGGNLAVIQSGLGTPSALKSEAGILFLEDIGERPHRVDRMLAQIEQAGLLDKTRAIVLGHFQLADKKDARDLWNDVIARFAKASRIPVFKGLPVGHDPKKQLPLPFGTNATLTRSRLVVDSGIR